MKRARLYAAALGAIALMALGVRLGEPSLALVRLGVVGAALGLLAWQDLHERRIPNRVVLGASFLCALLTALEGVWLSSMTIAAALVVVIFAVGLLRPRWLGMGDAKLALLLLLGLHGASPRALLFGFELAALIAVAPIIRRGRIPRDASLPLAPFLVMGSVLALAL